jgi:hypothetical protein
MQSTGSLLLARSLYRKNGPKWFPDCPRRIRTNAVRQKAPVANKINVAGSGTGTSSTLKSANADLDVTVGIRGGAGMVPTVNSTSVKPKSTGTSVSGGPLPTGFTANVMVHSSPFARTIGPIAGRQASAVTPGTPARVSEVSNPPRAVIAARTLTTWIGTGLIFSTVITKTPAAGPSNRSGVAPEVTVKVMAAGEGAESANVPKGVEPPPLRPGPQRGVRM